MQIFALENHQLSLTVGKKGAHKDYKGKRMQITI